MPCITGLDNLASPEGAIAESQALAAQAFGSEQCLYLVNGTSAGLQASSVSASLKDQIMPEQCQSVLSAGQQQDFHGSKVQNKVLSFLVHP